MVEFAEFGGIIVFFITQDLWIFDYFRSMVGRYIFGCCLLLVFRKAINCEDEGFIWICFVRRFFM